MLGEAVEERVRRGVVGLAQRAENPGGRGEHGEQGQVEVTGQLVQVPRAVDLGAQHGAHPLGVQRGQHPVGQHTGGVDDPGEGPLGRYPLERAREGVAVRDVAGDDLCRGAQLPQVGEEFHRSGRRGSPPADEQQVGHP